MENIDRLDIYKAITFVVLLGVLLVTVLVTGGYSTSEISGGAQSESDLVGLETEEGGQPPRPGEDDSTDAGSEQEPGTDMDESEEPDTGDVLEPGEVPPAPASVVVLTYYKEDGTLVTEDGQIVYVLDKVSMVWVPIIPDELADEVGQNQPELGAGEIWVLYTADMEGKYLWDAQVLVWVKGDLAMVPPDEPTETEPPPDSETEQEPTEVPSPTEPAQDEDSSLPEPNLPIPDPPPTPKNYTIRSGEFIYCIARRYDINPYQLSAYNGLGVNSYVYNGTRLSIPAGADPFPGNRALQSHPVWYEVQKGDTLNSIACQYGNVYPESIVYANGLEDNAGLVVGQMLYIP